MSYTDKVRYVLRANRGEILERLAYGDSLPNVKERAYHSTIPELFDDGLDSKTRYLLNQRGEDAAIIQDYVRKQLTILQLQQRAQIFERTARLIENGRITADQATENIRTLADEQEIDFFDTLSEYAYLTYDDYDMLDLWATRAVFESAWELEYGDLESSRYTPPTPTPIEGEEE